MCMQSKQRIIKLPRVDQRDAIGNAYSTRPREAPVEAADRELALPDLNGETPPLSDGERFS